MRNQHQMSSQERQSLVQLSQNPHASLMTRHLARIQTQHAKREALNARGIATLHT